MEIDNTFKIIKDNHFKIIKRQMITIKIWNKIDSKNDDNK